MGPSLGRIDHVHVFVTDQPRAERWYADVLGLHRDPALASWSEGGGPLMLRGPGDIMLALFERPAQANRTTIAFAVTADAFTAWRTRLEAHLDRPVDIVDHDVAWSIYFDDPDDNPFEITCYDYAPLLSEVAAHVRPR